MSEIITTWILWAIVTLGSPQYHIIQVLDEFPTNDICDGIAKAVATEIQKDMEEKEITNVDVTLACIPISEIKNPQNLNGSGLIVPKPVTKSKRVWIG